MGANHPTRLSNTFVFTEKFSWILIEPNKDFVLLNKLFRKKDIVLNIGIGKVQVYAEFKYTILMF